MNSIWICIVAIVGLTVASPVNKLDEDSFLQLLSKTEGLGRNSALESLFISVLEDFRQVMLTGSDDIPVLDPFHLDHLLVDDSIVPLPGAYLELNDLTASKLSTFELNHVSITSASIILQRYNVEVDAEVPALEVDVGKYDLFVNFAGLSLFGNGDARIVVVKPRIKVNLLVGIRLGLGAIYLNLLNTRIEVSLEDIQPALTGMFNDTAVDGFVNLFLRNIVLQIMSTYSEEITEIVSPLVQDIANDVLSNLNLIGIIG